MSGWTSIHSRRPEYGFPSNFNSNLPPSTSHLLLITWVIGSEALVEVKSPEQSDMSVYQQDTQRGGGVLLTKGPQAGLANPQSCSNFPPTHKLTGASRHRSGGTPEEVISAPWSWRPGEVVKSPTLPL